MIFAEPKGLGNSASLSEPKDPTKSDIYTYLGKNYPYLRENPIDQKITNI